MMKAPADRLNRHCCVQWVSPLRHCDVTQTYYKALFSSELILIGRMHFSRRRQIDYQSLISRSDALRYHWPARKNAYLCFLKD